MVRDDDFGEVPDLGPARDELDGPRTRPVAAKPKPIPEAPKSPPGSTGQGGDERSPKRGGHGFVYLLLLMVVVAAAGFGYWSLERNRMLEAQLTNLQQQQQVAAQKIAVLEGLISATDESAAKSGAALQAQMRKVLQEQSERIQHVDSEIAKLWTVAHQRNRPKIAELEKLLEGQQQKLDNQAGNLKSLTATLEQNRKQQDQTQKVVAAAGEQLNKLIAAQAQQQEASSKLATQLQLRDQANQELDVLQDTQISDLTKQLAALKANPTLPAKAAKTLEEQGRAIDSINAFRKQVNQEVLQLRDRVNYLQLKAANEPKS